MTPEQAAALLPGARVELGRVHATVDRGAWVEAVLAVRDGPVAATAFDLLTAVDDGDLVVVLHLWSPSERVSVLLSTRCPADDPVVPSLAGVFAGADWSERHAAEMFGLEFAGHPSPGRLLLPPAFEGAPLRKDLPLASRGVVAWPGAVDPEGAARRSRRGAKPVGVPEWGVSS